MSRWSGRKDAGGQSFTPGEAERVAVLMGEHVGSAHAIMLEDLRLAARVEPRTVRAILSARDGIDYVVAYTPDGAVYVAEWQDDAAEYNRKLHAQLATMQRRLDRRRDFAESRLMRRQGVLYS